VAKMPRKQKRANIFQFVIVFQCSVTHSRTSHAPHQAVTIKVGVLCACVQFQHSILHGFGSSVDLHILVKIKQVFFDFLS
jgi:hypothetical protein